MSETTLLPADLRLIAAGVLAVFLGWVVYLIRAHQLGLRESLLWFVSTLIALGFVVVPDLLQWFAALVGVRVPSNALFALAFVYVLVNLLSITITVSRQAAITRRLAQESALLRAELTELRSQLPAGDRAVP